MSGQKQDKAAQASAARASITAESRLKAKASLKARWKQRKECHEAAMCACEAIACNSADATELAQKAMKLERKR